MATAALATPPSLHVVAGVLLDADGRVLLATRPPGKHLAGMWEFPGGKREPGETAVAALQRELREELGIDACDVDVRPLARVPWRYGDTDLLLEALRVTRWTGTPRALEGQALRWVHPAAVDRRALVPADLPVLDAVVS